MAHGESIENAGLYTCNGCIYRYSLYVLGPSKRDVISSVKKKRFQTG